MIALMEWETNLHGEGEGEGGYTLIAEWSCQKVTRNKGLVFPGYTVSSNTHNWLEMISHNNNYNNNNNINNKNNNNNDDNNNDDDNKGNNRGKSQLQ